MMVKILTQVRGRATSMETPHALFQTGADETEDLAYLKTRQEPGTEIFDIEADTMEKVTDPATGSPQDHSGGGTQPAAGSATGAGTNPGQPAPPAKDLTSQQNPEFANWDSTTIVSPAIASFFSAVPATPWTSGQYAVTTDGQDVYWDGSVWQLGRAPTGTGGAAPAGPDPNDLSDQQNPMVLSLAERTVTTPGFGAAMPGVPSTAWTTGQYAVSSEGGYLYWDGTDWQSGKAP